MIVIGVASIGTIATIAEAIGDSTDMIAVLQYGLAVMLYKVITQNVLSGNTAWQVDNKLRIFKNSQNFTISIFFAGFQRAFAFGAALQQQQQQYQQQQQQQQRQPQQQQPLLQLQQQQDQEVNIFLILYL